MLSDRARIYVEGGRGGDGCVSFRREAHVARGGPDGGDGGGGGDVTLISDPSRRDLGGQRIARHFRAGAGAHGRGKRQHGARGSDQVILVPPGTQVEGLGGERFDLIRDGQRATVAHGGSGGHGNKRFAASTRQAPRFAERGLDGDSGWIELHMKLLADVGLIGLPNAGKSSLLSRLTRAAPKVADYPFTTLEPVLGTLETDDRQLVIADIPGLIEGAAEGAGLGLEFLAHVERCRVLVHLVEIGPDNAAAELEASASGEAPAGLTDAADRENPFYVYESIRRELSAYGGGLDALPELVVLSKSDLVTDTALESLLADWRRYLDSDCVGVLTASSATRAGLPELQRAIFVAVPEPGASEDDADENRGGAAPQVGSGAAGEHAFEVEHRVYRPTAEQGFRIAAAKDGTFVVEGRGVEVLVRRHDLSNQEALAYLERRLHEIGVVSALKAAGYERGDEVRIGTESFELDLG